MTAAIIAELKAVGKPVRGGPIKVPTSQLVGQTPSHANSAIFHCGGVHCASRDHYSEP